MTTSTDRAREALGAPAGDQPVNEKTQAIALRSHQLEQMVPQFQRAMPTGFEAMQLTRDVLTALRSNDDLWKCTPASLFGAAMTAAQLGLRVGVLGHGWLIPFENRKAEVHEAQWVLGYQGMIELAVRTDRIAGISGHAIYSNEKYRVVYGSEERIEHEPILNGDRGEPVAYYTQVWYTNGGYGMKPIGHDEMLEIREKLGAKAKRWDSPWQKHFRAMALKTCLRRMFTYMPKTSALQAALASDSVTRTNLDAEGLHQGTIPADDEGGQPPPPARERITVVSGPRTRVPDSRRRTALLNAAQERFGERLATVLVREVLKGEAVTIDYVTNDELAAVLALPPEADEPSQEELDEQLDAAYLADQQRRQEAMDSDGDQQ